MPPSTPNGRREGPARPAGEPRTAAGEAPLKPAEPGKVLLPPRAGEPDFPDSAAPAFPKAEGGGVSWSRANIAIATSLSPASSSPGARLDRERLEVVVVSRAKAGQPSETLPSAFLAFAPVAIGAPVARRGALARRCVCLDAPKEGKPPGIALPYSGSSGRQAAERRRSFALGGRPRPHGLASRAPARRAERKTRSPIRLGKAWRWSPAALGSCRGLRANDVTRDRRGGAGGAPREGGRRWVVGERSRAPRTVAVRAPRALES